MFESIRSRLTGWLTPARLGADTPAPAPGPVASFDAAKTTPDNRKHWRNADGLAAVSEALPQTRGVLRRRSRYECRNNTYAKGLISTLAGDLIGTGPRLQMTTPDADFNAFVEAEWRAWADTVHLADTLRLMDETRRRDGECFALFARNPDAEAAGLPGVDLLLIEGDQVAHPFGAAYGPVSGKGDDGVVCDPVTGRVLGYKVLKAHPGDMRLYADKFEADDVDADQVIHWFKRDRPGQLRGLPELAAALPLFAYLRRIDLATLAREEVAASMTAVLESDMPTSGEAEDFTPFEQIEIDRGMMVTLPAGQKLHQFESNRPGAVHGQYVDTILRSIGRAVDVPFGVVAGDSSKYNYSSGRLDLLAYDRRQDSERNLFRTKVLDRVLRAWWAEFQLMYPQALLVSPNPNRLPAHGWYFDARPSIDPLKDATADAQNLTNGVTSGTQVCAEYGQDLETVLDELVKERDMRLARGLPLPAYLKDPVPVTPNGKAPPADPSRADPPDPADTADQESELANAA